MKPCVCVNGSWTRGGSSIAYNFFRRIDETDYYELCFSFDFSKVGAKTGVSFAYSFPYTYTRLLKFVQDLPSKVEKDLLCQSHEGRQLPILRVGHGVQQAKRVIFVTGRVHPGESVASFAVEGLIKFLTSDHPQSKALLEAFEFHIVPMLNPDGVALGNYRFSACGHDLNRKWHSPVPALHP
jgi:murein tripeptide amidase MpaA